MRSGRIVVVVAVALATVVSGVAIAAGPPGASGSRAGVSRADLTSPMRMNVGPDGVSRPAGPATERARTGLRDALGRRAMLTVDERTGGVKAVGRLDGFLTRAS